jgi:hypothetical protein
MQKNHSYKINQKYNHSTKKENTMKIELNITSDHEVSEHTLKNIEEVLKNLNVNDYVIKDDKSKSKK